MTRMERATATWALRLAAAAGEAAVALAEEGVGAGGGDGGLAEDAAQRRCCPGLSCRCRVRGPDWRVGGQQPGPGHQVAGGAGSRSCPGRVSAMMARAGVGAARRGSQRAGPRRAARRRPGRCPASGPGGPVGVDAPGGGDRGDQLGDRGRSAGRSGRPGRRSGPAAAGPARRGGHRTCRPAPRPAASRLALHPAAGQGGQRLRVALPGDHRLDHRPAPTGGQLAGHRRRP